MRQKMKQSLPPVITHTPYLGEHNVLPRLPHLIVVPGTLLSQWENESKILFKCGSFDILVYGSGKGVRKQFWAPDGPFHASKNNVNKIIIASHSALQQDFSSIYFLIKKKGKLPWDTHRELPSYKSMVTNTLFGQQYLSVTIDEAHAFRNVGAKHSAALLIMKRAVLRIALTATPLQTSTKGFDEFMNLPKYF